MKRLDHAGIVPRAEGAPARPWTSFNDQISARGSTIAPDPDMAVGMFETNTKRLFRAGYSGWTNTLKAFGAGEGNPGKFLQLLSDAGLKQETLASLQG